MMAATLDIDSTVAHYRIRRHLGSGGMGEVYEAWDESLERPVALKVLPPEVVQNPDRVRRFVQEAKSASALSHPHIVTIYEIGDATVSTAAGEVEASIHYIAMELIDGSTYKEKIHREQSDPKDLLRWLGQAAEGVAKAHGEGIVHRDLKPDNIMISSDGYAKVLDFGLAKLTEPLGDSTKAPTMLAEETAEGAVLGTVGYMSPEQVQGKPADHRSDIFSFGCVLYEAMTRNRPFAGETSVDTMHQILRAKPTSVRELNPQAPAALRRMIRRCLVKDPERRYQSMKDLALELSDLVDEYDDLAAGEDSRTWSSTDSLAPIRERKGIPTTAWVAIGVVAVVALGFLLLRQRSAGPGGGKDGSLAATFTQITSHPGQEDFASLGPDGRFVVYAGLAADNWDLYLLRVDGGQPINLTESSTDDDYSPVFSPDGERIAFVSDRDGGGIFLMGATGESVKRLTDFGADPAWSPDGQQIVFATEEVPDPLSRATISELWMVEVETGETRKIYDGDAVEPQWSPDGNRIAFWAISGRGGGQRDIATLPAAGGEPVWITSDAALDWNPVWSPDGSSLYFSSDRGGSMNLWVVTIDQKTGEIRGEPGPLTTPSPWSGSISVSRDGKRILFTARDFRSNILKIPLDPDREVLTGSPIPVTRGTRPSIEPHPSPDGEWVVFRTSGQQEDLYVVRSDGSDLRQLTDDIFRDRGPSWSPNGERIAFYSNRSGRYDLWAIRPDGSGLEQLTETTGESFWFPHWSPDSDHLAVHDEFGAFLVDLDGPLPTGELEPLPPLDGDWIFRWPRWSPDGRRLAGVQIEGVEGEHTGIVIYTLETKSYETVLTPEPGHGSPKWLDDRRLFFFEGDRLLILDLQSREVRELGTRPEESLDFALSADSRTLFFRQSSRESDLWMATLD